MPDHPNRQACELVRNPVLGLPASRALQALAPELRALLAALLLDLRRDARLRSERSWASRKAFMAAYWAVVAVYAGHIARALCLKRGAMSRSPEMLLRQEGYPDLQAQDWAEASVLYASRRDRSGLGARMFPEAAIVLDGVAVGRISYNARIWPPGPWRPGMQPIHDGCLSGSEDAA